jgi:hypothetical protein
VRPEVLGKLKKKNPPHRHLIPRPSGLFHNIIMPQPTTLPRAPTHFLRTILMLPSHLCSGLQNALLPSDFSTALLTKFYYDVFPWITTYFLTSSGVRPSPFVTPVTIGPIVSSPDDIPVWSSWWNENWKVKAEVLGEDLPQCQSVHQKSHMT